jgi:mono/diheme cytochrome c family protein
MRVIAAALMTILALGAASADAGAQPRKPNAKAIALKNPVPATPASVKTGQQVYAKQCRHCHGLKGLGDGPMAPKNPSPANLTDAEWKFGGTDGEIFTTIKDGAPVAKSEMVGMKGTLVDKDIWHIVNFLRSIGPGAKKPAAKAASR